MKLELIEDFMGIVPEHNVQDESVGTIPLDSIGESHAVVDRYVTAAALDERVDQHLMQQRWFQEFLQNRKENWIAGSKGGYPNYYGE